MPCCRYWLDWYGSRIAAWRVIRAGYCLVPIVAVGRRSSCGRRRDVSSMCAGSTFCSGERDFPIWFIVWSRRRWRWCSRVGCWNRRRAWDYRLGWGISLRGRRWNRSSIRCATSWRRGWWWRHHPNARDGCKLFGGGTGNNGPPTFCVHIKDKNLPSSLFEVRGLRRSYVCMTRGIPIYGTDVWM